MKSHLFIHFLSPLLVLFFISCTESKNDSAIHSEGIEKSEVERTANLTFPFELVIDTTYVDTINSIHLKEHPRFPKCANDINQEGYPSILYSLEYFLIEEWELDNEFTFRLIYGTIPSDSVVIPINDYRAIYATTFDPQGQHVDTKIIGKSNVPKRSNETLEKVTSKVMEDYILITTHEEWTTQEGQFYSKWKDEELRIRPNGTFQMSSLIYY